MLTQKKDCFLVSTAIRSSSNDVWLNQNTLASAHSLAFTFFLRHYCSLRDCRGFKKNTRYISTTPDSSVGRTAREKLLTRLIEMLCNDTNTSNPQSRRSSSCSRVHPNASGLDRGVRLQQWRYVWAWKKTSVRNQNKRKKIRLCMRSWHRLRWRRNFRGSKEKCLVKTRSSGRKTSIWRYSAHVWMPGSSRLL